MLKGLKGLLNIFYVLSLICLDRKVNSLWKCGPLQSPSSVGELCGNFCTQNRRCNYGGTRRRNGVNVDKWDYSRRLDVRKCYAGKEPAAVKEPREPAFEEEDKKKNDQEIGSHRSGNTRDAELPGQAAGDLEVDAAGSEIFC